MIAIARKVLAMLLVAALVCGNPLAAVATPAGHSGGDHNHGASDVAATHHHHDHADDHGADDHGHALHGHGDVAQAGDVRAGDVRAGDVKSDAGCPPGHHHPDGPCCHMHAHCCLVLGFVPLGVAIEIGPDAGSNLAALNQSLPNGGIVNPLLRPPRHIA